MPFDTSGIFSRLYSWVADRDNSINIMAARMDAEDDGFATAINDILAGNQPFRGAIQTVNGTAAAPALSFSADPDTGLYRNAANQLSFSEGGTDRGRMYGQKNIVGTVAQTAGTPTGAILEEGSNASGSYIRFASGTMICWHTRTGSASGTTVAFGSLYRSPDVTWSYPSAFASAPVTSGQSTGGNRWVITYGATTSAVTFSEVNPLSSSAQQNATLFAIGRWF